MEDFLKNIFGKFLMLVIQIMSSFVVFVELQMLIVVLAKSCSSLGAQGSLFLIFSKF